MVKGFREFVVLEKKEQEKTGDLCIEGVSQYSVVNDYDGFFNDGDSVFVDESRLVKIISGGKDYYIISADNIYAYEDNEQD